MLQFSSARVLVTSATSNCTKAVCLPKHYVDLELPQMARADHSRSYHKEVALQPQLSTMHFESKKQKKRRNGRVHAQGVTRHLDSTSGVGRVGYMANRNLHVGVVAVIDVVLVVVDGDVGVTGTVLVAYAAQANSSSGSGSPCPCSASQSSEAGVEREEVQKLEQSQDDHQRFHHFLQRSHRTTAREKGDNQSRLAF
jgi:hypothetical protein